MEMKIGSNKNNKGFNFKLLPDKPLTADQMQNIKFGFPLVSKTISELVIKAEPPFTIGLFGKWGTGKSTIINLVEDELKKQKIQTVQFDVWKYEKDSLRRQFLINLDETLGLNLKYKKVLNQSLTTPISVGLFQQFKLHLQSFLAYSGFGILIVFLLLALAKFSTLSTFLLEKRIFNPKTLEFMYDFSFLALVLNFLLAGISIVYATITEDRTDSAEGFEYRFYDEVLGKISDKKLLIAIDNLDRTSHQNAVQLLTDIKTFLDGNSKYQNKVIFLIACDEKAIKKHLKESKFDNPSEFLRKFFSANLSIPAYLGEELDEYTRDLILETEIQELIKNDDLEWLITYAFRGNPREIKQFINTLVANYLLARNAEYDDDYKQIVTQGIITKNISSLAKLLIIKQKFPEVY